MLHYMEINQKIIVSRMQTGIPTSLSNSAGSPRRGPDLKN
jgi:hypothetical protein